MKQPKAPGMIEIATDDRRQFIGKVKLDKGDWTRKFAFTRPRPKGKGPWTFNVVGRPVMVKFISFKILRK